MKHGDQERDKGSNISIDIGPRRPHFDGVPCGVWRPNKIVEIRTLINRLDTMIAQVTIEARVVETTTRFLRELGIQWGLTAQYSPQLGTDTGVRFPNRVNVGGPIIGLPAGVAGPAGGYAVNFPVVAENPSGFGLTLGNFLDNFKLDISLQLLESEGHGQIISSPKITSKTINEGNEELATPGAAMVVPMLPNRGSGTTPPSVRVNEIW